MWRTNPELSFSISGKVKIVRRKQMKHGLGFNEAPHYSESLQPYGW